MSEECRKRNYIRKPESEKDKTKALKMFGPVAYSEWSRLNRRYGSR